MTDRLPKTDKKDEDEGLDWARIAGFTLVVAIHAAALLLLLAPPTPPQAEQGDEDVTRVVIIEPPPRGWPPRG
jgi:protein TonB